ncbi:MAG: hypothetical protein QXS91_01360 [Candidatus Anstonellales archaeon]
MQKIIFIGGASGVGKTTFARELAIKNKAEYLHFFKYFHSFFGKPDKKHYYELLNYFTQILIKQLKASDNDVFIDMHYALQLDSINCWSKRAVDPNAKFYPSLKKESIKLLKSYFDVYAIMLLTGYGNIDKRFGIRKEQFEKEQEGELEQYLNLPLENERKLMLLRTDLKFMAQLLQSYILGKRLENQMI